MLSLMMTKAYIVGPLIKKSIKVKMVLTSSENFSSLVGR